VAGVVSVFVTGSADGIGRQTARDLVRAGHRVLLHARNDHRAEAAAAAVPGAAGAVVGDLASLVQTHEVARQAAAAAPDVVIHNAGVLLTGSRHRPVTEDGLETTFQVNVLAPYLLTALLPRPARLIHLTSGLESSGTIDLADLQRERRRWDGYGAYNDSKLADIVLAFAVARRWPGTLSNAVDPGWIASRMGGRGAPGRLPEGADTQVWLATSDEPAARVSGRYFYRREERRASPAAYHPTVQDGLLAACARLTDVQLEAD
jgi:NAD(P)-dependent dehydrogenase (short-subunit alcohol dehydrogenase family)